MYKQLQTTSETQQVLEIELRSIIVAKEEELKTMTASLEQQLSELEATESNLSQEIVEKNLLIAELTSADSLRHAKYQDLKAEFDTLSENSNARDLRHFNEIATLKANVFSLQEQLREADTREKGFTAQNAQTDARVKKLSLELITIQGEKLILETEIASIHEQLSSTRKAADEQIAELQSAKALESSKLAEAVKILDDTKIQLAKSIEDANVSNLEHVAETEAHDDAMTEISQLLRENETRIHDLQFRYEMANSDHLAAHDAGDQEIQVLKTRLVNYTNELSLKVAAVHNLEQIIIQLNQEASDRTTHHAETINGLQEKIASSSRQLEDSQSHVSEKNRQNKDLEATLRLVQREFEVSSAANKAQDVRLAALQRDLEVKVAEMSNLRENLESTKDDLEAKENELVIEREARSEDKSASSLQLTELNHIAQNMETQFLAEIASRDADIIALNANIDGKRKELIDVTLSLGQLSREHQDLESKHLQLLEEYNVDKADHYADAQCAIDATNTLLRDLDEKQSVIDETQSQLVDVTSKLEQQTHEYHVLEANMNSTVEARNAEIMDMKNQLLQAQDSSEESTLR